MAKAYIEVRQIPEFRRLYKAVHEYLVAGLLYNETREAAIRKLDARDELIEAHDAIARTFPDEEDT